MKQFTLKHRYLTEDIYQKDGKPVFGILTIGGKPQYNKCVLVDTAQAADRHIQTVFTMEEIEALKKELNTSLEDYELVEA